MKEAKMKLGFKDKRPSDIQYLNSVKGCVIECNKLFPLYLMWCETFGLKECSVQSFMGEVRRRKIKKVLIDGKMVYKIG